MNPDEIQPDLPQEVDQDQMIIDYLKEIDDRLTALEDKEKQEGE